MATWRFLLVTTLAVSVGCAKPERPELVPALRMSPTPTWYHRTADSLTLRHAVDDAQAALAAGDCDLFGVVGFALSVPGLGMNWRSYRGVIRVFPGSDYIAVDGQNDYQTAAMVYAGRYNRVILGDCRCMPHAA